MPSSANSVKTRSSQVYGRTAETIPTGMPISSSHARPAPASTAVAGSRSAIELSTGTWYLNDVPRSPRVAPPAHERPAQRPDVTADALHLLFPPSGAVLSADGPVTIRVMGGRRPLTFLVDGAPLPAERIRRDVAWQPAGPGFYHLTVLDADGTSVRASVQVRAIP